jgi:predicted esterase
LKHVAEFVFIDGPHTLPDIYKNTRSEQQETTATTTTATTSEMNEHEDPGASHFVESNGTLSFPSNASFHNQWEQKRLRRGWLVSPEHYNAPTSIPRDEDVDHEQYHRQIAGLKESLEIIDNVLDTQGPWDGILGFSQGASIASLVAARECRKRAKRRFTFVICCSGYPSPLRTKEHEEIVSMPSLHVYGATKQDRQISEPESKSLWEQFDATKRVLLRHTAGHVIPSTRLAATRMAEFIAWAREEESTEQ